MKLTGGQALAQQLLREGICDVFSIPGVQLDWAVDGLRLAGDRARYAVPRHEQAAAYMADGYARSSGRIGACMVVPGPGLLNAMAGLATAYATSSPVLAIIGDIHSAGIGKGYGLLHEIPDQTAVLASATQLQLRASAPEQIPGVVRAAVRALRSGRPRPVGIEIAHDVLQASAELELLDPQPDDAQRLAPDPAALREAAAVLASARLPVIYAGGGIRAAGAGPALRALAEKLRAPVVMSGNGRGALDDRHPLALTTIGGRAVFPHADVVLVVGSRFFENMAVKPAWTAQDGKRYVYLNAHAADWSPPRLPGVCLLADARLGLEALAAELGTAHAKRPVDLERVRAWVHEQLRALEPLWSYVRALRAALPEDGFLVNELTQVGYAARLSFPVYAPDRFLTPGYQGTLGYGYPTSLGVCWANPGSPVVSLNGDGGFGWSLQELATARKYDLHSVAVVFNDGHYGNVRMMQRLNFGEKGAMGVELGNPHFGRLAQAFCVAYALAPGPAELETELRHAIAAGGPHLIEVPLGETPNPWSLNGLQLNAAISGTTPLSPPPPLEL